MIPIAKPSIGKEEEKAVVEVLRSGRLAQGEKVAKFEEAFAEYCGTKYAIATDNGTSALIVALLSAGIGSGDEVITTPFTFIATANAVIFTGARPVFVDIEPETYNIDPAEIEKVITKRTKAILPVHLYGLMTDMEKINKIAKKHKLVVIEDSAQAHGAHIGGKKAGSWGLAGCFSFYSTKNMTTGEGGMLTTSSPEFTKKVRLFRNQGMSTQYKYESLGYNFRMTEIAAAIGVEQLKKLEEFTEKRIKNATYLSEKLTGIRNIKTPVTPRGYKHVFNQYTIGVSSRVELISKLNKSGVGSKVYYSAPIHEEKYYKGLNHKRSLRNAEKTAKEVLSLPIHPSVTKHDLDKIVKVLDLG